MATAAERKAAQRSRQRKAGLEKLELWEPPEHHPKIKQYAERLSKRRTK